ncbi:MAG: aldo/keto reductase, partial [Burkholderiales bacterium]
FIKSAAALIGGFMSAPSPAPAQGVTAPTPGVIAKRKVPRSGEALPVVGLGTWQAFDIAGDAAAIAEAQEALRAFIQQGGALIDSSPMYGSAETVAGDLATALGIHAKLFVATKVWTSGRDAGIKQMESSFKKLAIDRKGSLDLMQVHNLVDTSVHLATLRAWKSEGRVRYLGVTHYNASAHDALARVLQSESVDFMQVNYSIAEPQADRRLLDVAADTGTAVIVNRPFAEGAMFGRIKGKPLPGFAQELGCSSWAQLFLKWICGHPAVTCAIPGTRNPKHVTDNLGAAIGPLPDLAMRNRIRDAFNA